MGSRMKSKLEEKKESLLKQLGYQNDKGMESHLGEHYRKGYDAGVSAYKEMLEGVGVGLKKYYVKASGHQNDESPVYARYSDYDVIDMMKGDDRWIYTIMQTVNPETNPLSTTTDWFVFIEALPVLAKLQQQAEKITELESRLKEAESVIKRLSECHLPSKPCAGSDLAQVMLEENCGIARQYMEKVK